MAESRDSWTSGDAYQNFMGRWSPRLAELFVPWLGVPAGRDWLDVGLRAQKRRTRWRIYSALPSTILPVK